jgi:hypothetical protein
MSELHRRTDNPVLCCVQSIHWINDTGVFEMAGMTKGDLEKEVEQKSRNFQEIWDRTPEINRFVFNDKIDKIRHSCSILETTIELSKDVKEAKKSLDKSRKTSNYISLIAVLYFILVENFEFLQSDFFSKLQNSDKIILYAIIFTLFSIIIYFRDLGKWIDLDSKSKKLDIFRLMQTHVDSRSRFYKYFILQNNEPFDEIKSYEYHLGYISECINLLSKINREAESSSADLNF